MQLPGSSTKVLFTSPRVSMYGVLMNKIERAIHFAVSSHAGQLDKSGRPYIEHVLRVGLAGKTEQERVVGFLHDIIEDTPFPVGLLEPEFGREIAEAVLSLSHAWLSPATGRPEIFKLFPGEKFQREPYESQIARAAVNPIGKAVKINDLLDNLSPDRIEALSWSEQQRLRQKYQRGLSQLGVLSY